MLTIRLSTFADQVIAALCNTLFYSLLQGVLLAVIAGLIVVCTRNVGAVIRYNLLVGVMVIFIVSSATTFLVQLDSIPKSIPLTGTNDFAVPDNGNYVFNPANHPQTPAPTIIAAPALKQDIIVKAINLLNDHHNAIVLVWFIFICIQGIQLAIGLRGVYRLKNYKIAAVTTDWMNKINSIAKRIGITKKIALLESGLAKVPMTIGHLKPVILMPVGLLAALSMDEVEAILMHELAHIRRRDYLINLLQSLVEIVFFFNPAVLWISAQISAERENCCDDVAFAHSNNKTSYLHALVICEEYQAPPAYAVAFAGQKNQLVDRVKRLVSKRNTSLNMFEKALLTICLVMSGLCLSAYAGREHIRQAAYKVLAVITPESSNKEGLLVATNQSAQTLRQDTAVTTPQKAVVGQQVKAASSNETESGKIEDTMDKSWVKMLTTEDSLLKIKSDVAAAKMDPKVNATIRTALSIQREYVITHILLGLINEGIVKNKGVSLSNTSFSLNEDEFIVNGAKQPEPIHKKYWAQLNTVPGLVSYNHNTKIAYNSYTNTKANTAINADAKIEPQTPADTEAEAAALKEKRRTAMTNDLLTDGLLKNTKKISFVLTTESFTLNGAKLPTDVQQKYRTKYLTGKMISWQYTYEGDPGNYKMNESFGELNN